MERMDTIDRILEQKNEQIKQLEEENKNLKEENDRLKNNAMEDMRVQTKLEEKIRFLEECLDNKEKVNKKLREELSAYDNIFMEEDTLQELKDLGKI